MVYIASSWSNEFFLDIVETFLEFNISIYNFRDPSGNSAFSWAQIDPSWKLWDVQDFNKNLNHPLAQKGFKVNDKALEESDSLLLLLPCGASAHLEAGKAWGQNKPVVIFNPKLEPFKPELMYSFADLITDRLDEVVDFFLERA